MGQHTNAECNGLIQNIKTIKYSLKNALVSKGQTVTDSTPLAEYPDKVNNILVGKPEEEKQVEYTTNGIKYITPSLGKTMSSARVVVNVATVPEETLTETITENGTSTFEPTEGSLFNRAVITTNIHPDDSLTKTYTTNGTKTETGEWKDATITINVPEQKPEETISVTYTTNGTKTLTPTQGSVFSGGTVVVNVPSKPEETLTQTITANGTTTYNPTAGSVFDKAVITVNVPTPTPTLQSKTATPTTSQQTISPDAGYDGLSSVTVNAVTSTIDANIQAGNIKKNVSILGVTGTYEGGITPTGTISISSNGTYDVTNYASASVNVPGGSGFEINASNGVKLQGSTFTTVPEGLTFNNNITDWSYMFGYNYYLTTAPTLDLSSGTNLSYMFVSDRSLQSVTLTNMNSATNTTYMFSDAQESLTSIHGLNMATVTSSYSTFGSGTFNLLTDLQMAPNAKINYTWDISKLKALNFNSVVSILTAAANTDYTFSRTLTMDIVTYDQENILTNLVAACTAKNWSIVGLIIEDTTPKWLKYAGASTVTYAFEGDPSASRTASNVINKSEGDMVAFEFNTPNSVTRVSTIDFSKIDSSYDTNNNFDGCTSLSIIDELNGGDGITNMDNFFRDCNNLSAIPNMDTSNVTSMYNTFCECHGITTIPLLDTSNVTNMKRMFFGCNYLVSIPAIDCSKATDTNSMFMWCNNSFTTIPEIDLSSTNDITNIFSNSTRITTLGGFKNLGDGFTAPRTLDLSSCSSLTHQSAVNVINDLADVSSKPGNGSTLSLYYYVRSQLSAAEIAVATNKGWIIQ